MARPIDHPFSQLSLKDGELILNRSSGTVPYMTTGDVKVLSVDEGEPSKSQRGYGEYRFTLNTAIDAIWREIFLKRIALAPDAAPELSEGSMLLVCDPANLERYYGLIKIAIEHTAAEYKDEKARVFESVKQQMAEREAATQRKAESDENVRRAARNLKL
ncbi:MAG TPA: hypothetical protein VN939_18630 [Chthoniobacterales bacterium]|jgi:hypothetical protein|nr:hypothetical protein [Chthoniobacterales bacterium]